MNDAPKEELLHKHGLKRTPIRTEMLDMFMAHDFALSANDIISGLKASHDRVTVYRALDSFVEKGLIHKVPDVQGSAAKYALCSHECTAGAHEDDHIHFVCHHCDQTYCLDDVLIPKVSLPEGFKKDHSDFTIHGTCESCSKA